MSSLRVFLVNSSIVFAYALLLFSSGLFSIGLNPDVSSGPVEAAALKIGGKTVTSLGRGSCKNDDHAEIILPQKVLQDHDNFRVTRKKVGKETEKKSPCDAEIKTGTALATFTKETPKIEQKHLLNSAGDECTSDKGAKGIYYLCIYPGSDGDDKLLAQVKYNFSTKSMQIFEPKNRTAYNGEVHFEVGFDGDPTEVETCYGIKDKCKIESLEEKAACPTTGCTTKKNALPSVAIKGLANNETYIFRSRLLNASSTTKWTKPFEEKPIPTAFPLNYYDGKGGVLTCQTSTKTSGLFFLAVLLSLVALRARRNLHFKGYGSFFFLAIFCFLPAQETRAEFGQLNVGLLGSPYLPNLDSEKNSSGGTIFPFYHCYFRSKPAKKTGPTLPLMGLEFDFHLWDGFGSLQLGFGLGYTYVKGLAVEMGSNKLPDCNRQIPNATVGLHMYQIRPQLTYLFNPYAEYFPLFPYVRTALIAHGYAFTTGTKLAEKAVNQSHPEMTNKPTGFQFGYQAAVGLMLMLDFLEPGAIRSGRGAGTLNHVYLKSELSYTKIDTFGRGGYQFSPKDIMGSKTLPLMWTFGIVFEMP